MKNEDKEKEFVVVDLQKDEDNKPSEETDAEGQKDVGIEAPLAEDENSEKKRTHRYVVAAVIVLLVIIGLVVGLTVGLQDNLEPNEDPKDPSPLSPLTWQDPVPLCGVDDHGYPVALSDPSAVPGKVLTSEDLGLELMTYQGVNNEVSETFQLMSGAMGVLGAGILAAGPGGIFSGCLVLLGAGALGIMSQKTAGSEFDELSRFIANQFLVMDSKIDSLSEHVDKNFALMRAEEGDMILDEIAQQMGRISDAYKKMIQTLDMDETDPSYNITKADYVDKFRQACNNNDYSPEDIIRILYGYACGNDFSRRMCAQSDGQDTGTCNYGSRNRYYLLDKYRDIEVYGKFQSFYDWMMSSLLEASFLHSVCLPADPSTCVIPNNPVEEENNRKLANMIAQVAFNLEWAKACVAPCKKVKIVEISTSSRLHWDAVVGYNVESIVDPPDEGARTTTLFDEMRRDKLDQNVTVNSNYFFVKKDDRFRLIVTLKDSPIPKPDSVVTFPPTKLYTDWFGPKDWYKATADPYPIVAITVFLSSFFGPHPDFPWSLYLEVTGADCPSNFCTAPERSFCDSNYLYCDITKSRCFDKLSDGEECSANYMCESTNCDKGICKKQDCSPDGPFCPSSTYCDPFRNKCQIKQESGDYCRMDDECVSGICSTTENKCIDCSPERPCMNDREYCDASARCLPKLDTGESCETDTHCTSGMCETFYVQVPSSSYNISQCVTCRVDEDCLEGVEFCHWADCERKKVYHEPCESNAECISGACMTAGYCGCDRSDPFNSCEYVDHICDRSNTCNWLAEYIPCNATSPSCPMLDSGNEVLTTSYCDIELSLCFYHKYSGETCNQDMECENNCVDGLCT